MGTSVAAVASRENLQNRPFPNYHWLLFQSESWCLSFHMKICFHLHLNENYFHLKGWAPGLALKKRPKNGQLNSALLRQMNSSNVVHVHYGVIRLQLSESFRFSVATWCFCCFNSFEMANFEQGRENRVNSNDANKKIASCDKRFVK